MGKWILCGMLMSALPALGLLVTTLIFLRLLLRRPKRVDWGKAEAYLP